jgi:hypothetical protein
MLCLINKNPITHTGRGYAITDSFNDPGTIAVGNHRPSIEQIGKCSRTFLHVGRIDRCGVHTHQDFPRGGLRHWPITLL